MLTFVRKGWSVNISVMAYDTAIGFLYQEKGDKGVWLFNPHHGIRWSITYLKEIAAEMERLNAEV
jgi:hypothetical protein